jgi:predicted ATPase
MKITVKGVRSLGSEVSGVKIVGAAILTGANSSGKSSYVLGLKLLNELLNGQSSYLGKDIISKTIEVKNIDPFYSTRNISNGEKVIINIEINRPSGLNLNITLSPKDDDSYFVSSVDLLVQSTILSSRAYESKIVNLKNYNFSVPILNSLNFLKNQGPDSDKLFESHFFKFFAQRAKKNRSIISLKDFLMLTFKKNEMSHNHDVYNDNNFINYLNGFRFLSLKSDFYIEEIHQAFEMYDELFASKTSKAVNDLYSEVSIVGNGYSSDDRDVLLNALRAKIANSYKAGKINKHLAEFEKCSFRKVDENSPLFQMKKYREGNETRVILSPASPIVLVSEFLSGFWDLVIEYCLLNTKISVIDKLEISTKSFFTAEDKEIYGTLRNVEAKGYFKKEYLGTIFKELTGLGEELRIEKVLKGHIKGVFVLNEKQEPTNIAHLGTGHYFLIILYLKLLETLESQFYFDRNVSNKSTLSEKSLVRSVGCSQKEILVLVEPESFLHPNAQVQLANLILFFVSKGLRVLIETHSEHFIRAIQLAVAKKEISTSNLNVYYFENEEGTVIRSIRMDENGFLLDKFGEGFIDETPRLIQDFFKANKN